MNPKVTMVYVCPVESLGEKYSQYAHRFALTYNQFKPDYEHKVVVVSNGGKPSGETQLLFSSLNPEFIVHDNTGWDIGAYQLAAKTFPCDLMVFFGVSAYIKHPRWLNRAVESFQKYGRAQYGTMGNKGIYATHPHIRTTSFWLPPDLMNKYPMRVTRPEQRYQFEHGDGCFTDWITSQGLKSWVVSSFGEHEWDEWDRINNGFHQGDQSTMLVGDRLTEPPFFPTP